jgi:hypothetical protein
MRARAGRQARAGGRGRPALRQAGRRGGRRAGGQAGRQALCCNAARSEGRWLGEAASRGGAAGGC